MYPHEENPILERQRQAEEVLTVLDLLTNTNPEQGKTIRESVLQTAHAFAQCIEEGMLLDDKDTEEGSSWHQKETSAHEAFIAALSTLRDALGEDSPKALTDLSHITTNSLAMHIARVSEYADAKHAT
ncbi:MAG: hypothetical protein H8D63_03245 [Parcubacteria group bacterium]|nr:hypothetical protein [Parcubacteria group bacterium]